MGQITATRNLVATKVVRHAGQKANCAVIITVGMAKAAFSKVRHDKTRDNFNINDFKNTNSGVFVNHVQCLTFGPLNVRSLLPKIDEIGCI